MDETLPTVCIARHGETAWSLTGQHTGLTDLPLTERADRIVRRIRGATGNVLLFSSGHFLRVFAVRWLGMETLNGKFFMLSTASVSTLGYGNSRNEPAILLWNDTSHLEVTSERNT